MQWMVRSMSATPMLVVVLLSVAAVVIPLSDFLNSFSDFFQTLFKPTDSCITFFIIFNLTVTFQLGHFEFHFCK